MEGLQTGIFNWDKNYLCHPLRVILWSAWCHGHMFLVKSPDHASHELASCFAFHWMYLIMIIDGIMDELLIAKWCQLTDG
jgi:hypothetical protein